MMNYESKFIERIKEIYTQNGFGRLLKTDMDIIVFDFIVSESFKNSKNYFLSDGSINYMSLSKSDMHKISRELKISEAKVKNYIYSASLKFQNQTSIIETFPEILQKNIKNIIPPKENLLNGQIRIYVPNILFKEEIETRLSKLGGIPDYGFNKDILSLEIADFIFLLKSELSTEEMKNLCLGLIQKVKLSENDEDYKKFIKDMNKKEPREILNLFLKDLGKKIIGESSDFALNYIFDFFKK